MWINEQQKHDKPASFDEARRQIRNNMGHRYSNLLTHIIFSVKDRRNMLYKEMRTDLFPYIHGLAKYIDCQEEHHKRFPLGEELEMFFEKNKVSPLPTGGL